MSLTKGPIAPPNSQAFQPWSTPPTLSPTFPAPSPSSHHDSRKVALFCLLTKCSIKHPHYTRDIMRERWYRGEEADSTPSELQCNECGTSTAGSSPKRDYSKIPPHRFPSYPRTILHRSPDTGISKHTALTSHSLAWYLPGLPLACNIQPDPSHSSEHHLHLPQPVLPGTRAPPWRLGSLSLTHTLQTLAHLAHSMSLWQAPYPP